MSRIIRRRTVLAGLGAASLAMTIKGSRAQSSPITLGFVGPLSGPQAATGVPYRIGAEAARDYLNKNGGIGGRKVELKIIDDVGNPNNTVSVYRQYVGEGINLISGPPATGPMLSVVGLLPQLHCVGINLGSPDDRLSHDYFNRNVFLTSNSGYTRWHHIAEVMARKFPDVTTWTGAHADIAGPRDNWAGFVHALKDMYPRIAKKDVTIIDPVIAKFEAVDYKNQISALMASPAVGFWNNLFGSDGITFFRQAAPFGLTKKFQVIVDTGLDMDLPKTLKNGVPPDMWSICFWYYGAFEHNPLSVDLTKYWQTTTGDAYPHGYAALGQTSILAFAAAIRATGGSTDTDKIIAALEDLKFDTARGISYYRKEDHRNISRENLVRWEPSEASPGWKMTENVTIEDSDITNPPAPGVKWQN